jgi:hypothetical protein
MIVPPRSLCAMHLVTCQCGHVGAVPSGLMGTLLTCSRCGHVALAKGKRIIARRDARLVPVVVEQTNHDETNSGAWGLGR